MFDRLKGNERISTNVDSRRAPIAIGLNLNTYFRSFRNVKHANISIKNSLNSFSDRKS